MEDMALDHNMELAPDGHGLLDNHEDIEIDLDIAQDPAEDRDIDVVVDDASVTASDHPGSLPGGQDVPNDADMLDEEYPEDQVANPEFSYHQQEQDQYIDEGSYRGDDTYEAEMEDEYEEDIDAPIPGTSTLDLERAIPEEGHHDTAGTPAPQRSESPVQTTTAKSPGHGPTPNHNLPVHSATPEAAPVKEQGTDIHEGGVPLAEDEGENYPDEQYHEGGKVEEEDEADRGWVDTNDRLSEKPGQSDVSESHDVAHDNGKGGHAQEEYGTVDQSTKESNEYVNLHNIKILYQENEISLFPPMEDDPTETYFLEDTAVAHEPISQVLHSCRHVLNEHIGEDEELVLDIDCLDLQLSQSASQDSSISLFQISQLYHNLCLNDGVNTPEPLYLSLTSRRSFDSLIGGLLQAVETGKGLSSINKWEDYAEDYEPEDGEDDTAILEEEETDNPEFVDNGDVDASRTQPSESERKALETPEENIRRGSQTLYDEESREPVMAEASDSRRPSGEHRDRQSLVPTALDQPAEEYSSANSGGFQDVQDSYENEPVEETTVVRHDEQQYDLTAEDYVDLAEETPESGKADRRESLLDEATVQVPNVQDEDLSISNHVPDISVQQPETEQTISPELERHSRASPSEQPIGSDSTLRETHDPDNLLETGTDTRDDSIVTGRDEFTEPHVRLPETTSDETAIDISPEDNEQVNNVADGLLDVSNVDEEAQPATPKSAHSLLDIEEDILRSPVAEDSTLGPSVIDPGTDLVSDGRRQQDVQADPGMTNGVDNADPSGLESGEVTPSEEKGFFLQSEESLVTGSPAVKRSRPDDDIDVLEDSLPEMKRHRSE